MSFPRHYRILFIENFGNNARKSIFFGLTAYVLPLRYFISGESNENSTAHEYSAWLE